MDMAATLPEIKEQIELNLFALAVSKRSAFLVQSNGRLIASLAFD
jgi:hypothetical protein